MPTKTKAKTVKYSYERKGTAPRKGDKVISTDSRDTDPYLKPRAVTKVDRDSNAVHVRKNKSDPFKVEFCYTEFTVSKTARVLKRAATTTRARVAK